MKINVRIGDRTFEVEVGDLTARPVVATIGDERFEVWPEDEPLSRASHSEQHPAHPQPESRPGTPAVHSPATNGSGHANGNGHTHTNGNGHVQPHINGNGKSNGNGNGRHPDSNGHSAKLTEVRAPIPGVILSVAAQPGAHVEVGEELCVLEAMKMKNIIRASRQGRLAAVHVSPSQAVGSRELLVEYEA